MPWETLRQRQLEGLHARGFTDLHPAHLTVFQYPGPHDVRPLDLATRTRMSKQAMNHLLGQLERLGYVTRRADPEDHRYTRVDLTPRGDATIRAIREIILEVEAEWEAEVGPKRFTQLKRLLAELAATAAVRT
ncbi:MAG: MarR family transcriptional regulator [Actinomycetia bacterium]|jgi:DNA-binding MarR family transcriptional regulator|nr:MarR family transcriptional regulator [Actinomycetes bacterium]